MVIARQPLFTYLLPVSYPVGYPDNDYPITAALTAGGTIWTKFSSLLRNSMPITMIYGRSSNLANYVIILCCGWPDWGEFGNLMQNSTQIIATWSKSQRKEFQYSGRMLFFKP